LVIVNKLSLKVSPWGARGWSQFCFAKLLLARGARGIVAKILFCGAAAKKIGAESPVFGAARQKRARLFLNLLTVPNWLQFEGFPDFGRYFLKL
jgi:hypothetical protein